MKVSMQVTIDVDMDTWKDEYGVGTVKQVREDVRSYFENHIKMAPAVESCDATVVIR